MTATKRKRLWLGKPAPDAERTLVAGAGKLYGKSYKLHLELDPSKLFPKPPVAGDSPTMPKGFVTVEGKIVAELTVKRAGQPDAAIEQESGNEAVERSLVERWKWNEKELDGSIWEVVAPLELELKVITLEGPKFELDKTDSRFDLVHFGISSELKCTLGETGVGSVKLDFVTLEFEADKDKYRAKLLNVEFKAGFKHTFEAVDLGPLGKWDIEASFTPALEIEPNWRGFLAEAEESIEETANRLAPQLFTVEMLGIVVEALTVAGVVAACVLMWIDSADTTGYEAANLDKRVPDVLDTMIRGFLDALVSEDHSDLPADGRPEKVGFVAGRRFRDNCVHAIRSVRPKPFSESSRGEEKELNRAVYDLLADPARRPDLESNARQLLRPHAGEFVFRAFGEKHKPTFKNSILGAAANITVLQGAWASCFDGQSPRGEDARKMFKQYLDPNQASTVDRQIPSK